MQTTSLSDQSKPPVFSVDEKLLLHRYRESKGSDLTDAEKAQAIQWLRKHNQRTSLLGYALKGLVKTDFQNGELKVRPNAATESILGER